MRKKNFDLHILRQILPVPFLFDGMKNNYDQGMIQEDSDCLPNDDSPKGRPSFALALGGGVARGWAHIGVLERLIEEGLEPDIVVGSSIGALVGGCYVAGKLDELKQWALQLNRRRLIGYLDIKLRAGGLLAGERLGRKLLESLGDVCIENLPKPFIAVAAELATGHEIWLRKGPLAPALRASYALPGAFAPVKVEGRWLIDGALVNPVPVSACRALGARMVAAVSLNGFSYGSMLAQSDHPDPFALTDESGEEITTGLAINKFRADRLVMKQLFGEGKQGKTPGLTGVMVGALNLIMDRLGRSRMAGDPPDAYIIPHIGHIGMMEFTRAEELIELGRQSVDTELPVIRHMLRVLG